MAGLWKNLKLQAKFTLVVGAGLLTLAASTAAVVSYFEYSNIEQKLRASSENEVNSLNSLVDSAMKMRFNDPQNVAIKVFNEWFESRNRGSTGKLWAVWGPSVTAYMAKTTPEHRPKVALDAIDEEVLRTGQPVGRFVNDTYRYSMPIVEGSALMKQESCIGCHGAAMGSKDGDVIAVFSNSDMTTGDFAALRQRILILAAGALVGIMLLLLAIWSI